MYIPINDRPQYAPFVAQLAGSTAKETLSFCLVWTKCISNGYLKEKEKPEMISRSYILTMFRNDMYRGSPTYTVFSTADPTTAVFGLCMCRWGIFALVGDPLQS